VEASGAGVDPRNDGKLLHLSGGLSSSRPAQDPVFGVVSPELLVLRRKVEMYQWKESKTSHSSTSVGGTKTTETTYDYDKVWSEQPIDSGSFHSSAQHHNPEMPLESATTVSQSAKLQAFDVDPALLEHCKKLSPVGDSAPPPEGYRQDSGHLYRGADPASPQVGDIRVSFSGLAQQTVSVVAQQSSGTLAPFRASNGYLIALIEPGTVDAKTQFAEARAEENQLTWILRAVGFVLMLVGFMLALRPLSVLGSVLPFLGGLIEAGAFFFALAMAAPLTLLTIAFAWLAHRPLLAGALIAAAATAWFLSWRHRPRKQGAMAAAA